jgi:hypothetical protein
VITFRLARDEVARLTTALSAVPGSLSHHALARKVVLDFVEGHLVYLSRRDRERSR